MSIYGHVTKIELSLKNIITHMHLNADFGLHNILITDQQNKQPINDYPCLV